MRRRYSGIVCAIALSIASVSLGFNGALAQGRPGDGKQAPVSAASRLPANYRQLVAQYVSAHNRYVIRDAMISVPYNKYGGILRDGTIPAVCVAIYRDNPLGMVVRDNWVLTVENGRVQELAIGLDTCSGLSPFKELRRR